MTFKGQLKRKYKIKIKQKIYFKTTYLKEVDDINNILYIFHILQISFNIQFHPNY